MPSWKTVWKVALAVVAAAAAMFGRTGHDGFSVDFRVGLAIVSVIALAIVAPGFFLGKRDGADYSAEIDALHKREREKSEMNKRSDNEG